MSTMTVDTNSSSLIESDALSSAMMRVTASRDYRTTVGKIEVADTKMSMRDVNVSYGDKQAVFGVDLDIAKNEVIAMIGPSGCGKSTFLRCMNRMNDTIEGCVVSGSLKLDDQDIYDPKLDVVPLRSTSGDGISEAESFS